MKKYILGILMLASLISCNKPTEETKQYLALQEAKARAQGDLTYTIQTDSLIENWGGTIVRYDLTKDEVSHKSQMFDMWRGDEAGNIYGQNFTIPNEGHGIRYAPYDPANPGGPKIIRTFTWEMDPVTKKIIAQIGSNRAEIITNIPYIIIHQLAGLGVNEVERWYYGHQVTNGLYMDGNGAKRTS